MNFLKVRTLKRRVDILFQALTRFSILEFSTMKTLSVDLEICHHPV